MTHSREANNASIVGGRVKSARMLSGLNRRAFSLRSKISMATLRTWEEPNAGRKGLTFKGAERLVEALQEMNIGCSIDWLLSGQGLSPRILPTQWGQDFEIASESGWGEEESIIKDIESFKINNPNSIVTLVSDTLMLPRYSPGDYVGGIKVSTDDIPNLIGADCIVESSDTTLVRRIVAHNTEGYTLSGLNLGITNQEIFMINAQLSFAAQIVWHRWRGSKK